MTKHYGINMMDLIQLDMHLSLKMQEGGCAFGAIVGGPCLEQRKRCAEEVAQRNVSGSSLFLKWHLTKLIFYYY